MKKIYSVLLILLFSVTVFAQAPEKISYQAVIRNLNNTLLANQNIGMQISILKGSATGSAVYTETQTTTSNANGLISIEIGAGTVVNGTFSTIDWSAGPYFIKTEVDPDGGNSYSIVGTSQLLSVPFAFYAKTAENSVKVDAEASRAANAENTLQLKLDTLVAKQTTYTSLLQGFVGKINSLQSTVTTDSTQIVSLQNSLTTSQATVTTLNTQLAATTQANAASIASLKTQLTAANNKVTALTATLGTKDATITALTAQVSDLNTALANAQAKNDADKAALQQQIDGLTYTIALNNLTVFNASNCRKFGVNLYAFTGGSIEYAEVADTTSLYAYRAAFHAARVAGVYFGSFAEVRAISVATALNLINAGTSNKTDFYTLYDEVIQGSGNYQAVDSSYLSVYKTAIAAAKATKGSDLTLAEVQAIISSINPPYRL